jgi:MFS family permease
MTVPMQSEASWFHPSRPAYRYAVLLFVGLLPFGSYFAYDSIGALETVLMKLWHTDQSGVGSLYTWYSIAPILFVAPAGLMIDRIGTRLASLILSALVVLGACIVALAPSVTIAAIGRFIFGAGSESLIVAQSAILARWFRGKELALSFGVTLTIMRLGTLFSFNGISSVANRYGVNQALWVAAALCAFSLLCNFVYFAMDKHGEAALGLAEAGAGDKIALGDVKKFGRSFWYAVILCTTFYSAIFPFTALSTDFFHTKYGLPLTVAAAHVEGLFQSVWYFISHTFTTAGGTTSIIIAASMCFAPFAGGLVDRIGRRASLMALGALLMIPSHLVLGFTMVPPFLPMILLGASFVLVPAAIWPSVPLIVEKNVTGTAFGVMTMVQNAGLALFPWVNGKLQVATHGYEASAVMFASLGVVGFLFALLLLGSDRRTGGALERGGHAG